MDLLCSVGQRMCALVVRYTYGEVFTMKELVEENGEFFLFLKREYGERQFSVNELELMFVAYVAGRYGIKPQKAALLSPIERTQ